MCARVCVYTHAHMYLYFYTHMNIHAMNIREHPLCQALFSLLVTAVNKQTKNHALEV